MTLQKLKAIKRTLVLLRKALKKRRAQRLKLLEQQGKSDAEIRKLRGELDQYITRFGCLSCREIHHGDCCPPHECRTRGFAWYSTTQAVNRFNAMHQENKRLREALQRIEEAGSYGFEPGHVTRPHDLAKMAQQALRAR